MSLLWGPVRAKKRSRTSLLNLEKNAQVSKVVPCCKNGKSGRPNTTFTADSIAITLRLGYSLNAVY
ncbi:hypothetical protein LNA01_23970 [Companilactobacillus nantensis]|nr:hypothetical protein LNA01_23970 [Companilactobacillus nantensis]